MNYSMEVYKAMDHLTNITYMNIFSKNKHENELVISNIDFNNPNHLFVLEVAQIYSRLNDVPVYIMRSNRFKMLWWNWEKRKAWAPMKYLSTKGYQRMRPLRPLLADNHYTLYPKSLLNFEEVAIDREVLGKDFTFGDIYERYYKKG